MVGGLGGGGKARRGYGPGGHLARPSSVGDFNEIEEDGWSINQMPDHEVPAEFEKMLENMNLSDVSFSFDNLNFKKGSQNKTKQDFKNKYLYYELFHFVSEW